MALSKVQIFNKKTATFLFLIVVMLYFATFLLGELMLAENHLGRYLKEGEVTIKEATIIQNNYFSYTDPNHETSPNDYWLSATIFYLIQHTFGFEILHIFGIILMLSSWFALFFYMKKNIQSLFFLFITSLFLPILTNNFAITPYLFSLFFSSIYIIILLKYLNDKLSYKTLFILPFLQIIWANCHIFAALAHFIILIAIVQALVNFFVLKQHSMKKVIYLLVVFVTCLFTNCLHPSFTQILSHSIHYIIEIYTLSPSNIWQEYLGTKSPIVLCSIVFAILAFASFIFQESFLQNPISIFTFLLQLFVFSLFFNYIELMPIFAMISLLTVSLNIYSYIGKYRSQFVDKILYHLKSPIIFLYIALSVLIHKTIFYPPILKQETTTYLGISSQQLNVANFIKNNRLQGPLFNNALASSYLIYNNFPNQKTYVLDKKNAHSIEFMISDYFPAILNLENWNVVQEKYNFNAVFFYLQKEKIAHLEFLGQLLKQQTKWALVYHEKEKVAILAKRNERNKSIIEKYEILPEVKETESSE